MQRWITLLGASGLIAMACFPDGTLAGNGNGNNGNKGHNQVTINITRNIVVGNGNGSGNVHGKGGDDRNHIPLAVAAYRHNIAPVAAKKKS